MKYCHKPLRHLLMCACLYVCVSLYVLADEIRYAIKANRTVEAVCALTGEIRYSTKTTMSPRFIVCCAHAHTSVRVCVLADEITCTTKTIPALRVMVSVWLWWQQKNPLKPQRQTFVFITCLCVFVCVCACVCVTQKLSMLTFLLEPPLKSPSLGGLGSSESHLHTWYNPHPYLSLCFRHPRLHHCVTSLLAWSVCVWACVFPVQINFCQHTLWQCFLSSFVLLSDSNCAFKKTY